MRVLYGLRRLQRPHRPDREAAVRNGQEYLRKVSGQNPEPSMWFAF